jgi:hypothetical protein
MFNQTGCSVGADGNGEGNELGNISDSVRPNYSRKRKNAIGNEGLEVVNGLDNTRVERGDGFGLALFEVGEVDGGSAGGADGTPGFEERWAEFVPSITVDAGAS